jgi:hypothetical protein
MPSLPIGGSARASHWMRPGACGRIADVGAQAGGEVAQVPRAGADAMAESVTAGHAAPRECRG